MNRRTSSSVPPWPAKQTSECPLIPWLMTNGSADMTSKFTSMRTTRFATIAHRRISKPAIVLSNKRRKKKQQTKCKQRKNASRGCSSNIRCLYVKWNQLYCLSVCLSVCCWRLLWLLLLEIVRWYRWMVCDGIVDRTHTHTMFVHSGQSVCGRCVCMEITELMAHINKERERLKYWINTQTNRNGSPPLRSITTAECQ